MIVDSCVDEKAAADMFSKNSEDFMNNQEGNTVEDLPGNTVVMKSTMQRKSRKTTKRISEQQSWSKTNSTKSVMHRSNIKELIKHGNLTAIEEIVIQGFGDRLIGETSSAPLVQEFLDRVPALIEQITEIHKAAAKGNVEEFKSLLDRKGIILARDQIGATPLHKSVLYGHQELTDYIANNFPVALDARDHEGRTPLHYAGVLDDDSQIYNHLIKAGASPLLPDYRGKSADYYQRYPDQLNISQLIKRSQRLNANYAINTANRVKYKSPLRKRGWSPNSRKSEPGASGPHSDAGLSDDQDCADVDDGSSNGSAGSYTNAPFSKPSLRSRPANILPLSTSLKRFEVTSANIKKWIEEQDLEALEGAVLEGHGERVRNKVEILDTKADTLQNYLEETFPKIMNKIRVIHAAVSCGDINGLQSHLDKNDYALAKDHLGMAPLHKAVILGHIDVVHFILEKFPETINARDREGRTALHYAAATTNRNGAKIYKILLRAGADPRVRDSNNKTAEYYRVHLLPLPSELSKLSVNSKRKQTMNGVGLSPITKRRQFLLPSIQEKITSALHDGDAAQLKELVLEGYGDAIIGRSSWGEEARKFLRNLPHFMDNIKSLQASIVNGDLNNCERILQNDTYLRAKDENGLLPIHLAVNGNQREIVEFILTKYPSCVNIKDNYGRTPLHIAAQNKYNELYKKIVELGGNPKILDLKGRTADHYFKVQFYNEYRLGNNFSQRAEKNSAISQITDTSAVETTDSNEKYENEFERDSDIEDGKAKANEGRNKDRDSGLGTADKQQTEDIIQTLSQLDKSSKEDEINEEKDDAPEAVKEDVSEEINTNENKLEENVETETKESEISNNVDETERKEDKIDEIVEINEDSSKHVEDVKNGESEMKIADLKQKETKVLEKKKTKTISQRRAPQNNVRKQMSVTKPPNTDKKALTRKTSLPTMNSNKNIVTKTQKINSKKSIENGEKVENKNVKSMKSNNENKDKKETNALQSSAIIVAEKLVNSYSLEEINNDANKTIAFKVNDNDTDLKQGINGNETEIDEQDALGLSNNLSGETSDKQSFETVIENVNDADAKSDVQTKSDVEQKESEQQINSDVIEITPVTNNETTEEYADDFENENEDVTKSELKSEESDIQTISENLKSEEETKVVEDSIEKIKDELSAKYAINDNTETNENNPEDQKTEEKENSNLTSENATIEAVSESEVEKEESATEAEQSQELESNLEVIEEANNEETVEGNELPNSGSLTVENDNNDKAKEENIASENEVKTESKTPENIDENSNENEITKIEEQTESEAEHEIKLKVESDIEPQSEAPNPSEISDTESSRQEEVIEKNENSINTEVTEEKLDKSETESENNNDIVQNETDTANKNEAVINEMVDDINVVDSDKINEETQLQEQSETVETEVRENVLTNEEKPIETLDVTVEQQSTQETGNTLEAAIKETENDVENIIEMNANENVDENPEKEEIEATIEPEKLTDSEQITQSNEIAETKNVVESDNTSGDDIINEENETVKPDNAGEAEKLIEPVTTEVDLTTDTTVEPEKNEESKKIEEPVKSSRIEKSDVSEMKESEHKDENIGSVELKGNEDVKEMNTERRKSDISIRSQGMFVENEETHTRKEKEYDQASLKSMDGRQSEIGKRVMNVDDRLNELIEKWFREGDLLRLEHVVIAGQGERLVGKKTDDKQVQEFIDLVPAYMAKIKNVHETVVRGNFNEVRHVLTRKRFALSRDKFGASPLHLAVLHGHMDVLVYIITQFPETIDGPDNEGRTALHYAAVIGEEDIQYYEILKKAGAKDNILDKMGNTASYYLQNPGVLTIRELLENYKQDPETSKKEPEQVDVWKRPPTADIESQLTPSSSGSPENRAGSAGSQRRTRHKREVSAVVHVDAEAHEIEVKEDENTKEEIESMSSQFEEALKEEKERLQENFDKVMRNASSHGPESLNGDSNGTLSIGSSDSDFNLCQVKNEKGQTILHLAASKPQKKAVLYRMLSQAEYLIPERDVKYRTIRDIAIDKQLKQNVVTIDAYVLDAFVKGNIRFVQKLSHEGYDLHNIVDSDGNDVTSVLRRNNISSMLTLLEDISYFQKAKNELHTFIKNDYTEGVRDKVESDPTLITAKNRRGRSALHIAVLFPNIEIVECLVTVNPASVNIQDNLGRTALHYAMANSRVEEMAKILASAGANRVIRDVQMRTPSYYFVYKDEIKEIRREEQALE